MLGWQSPFVLSLGLLARAAAQEPDSDLQRAQHLERMREVAQSIRLLADPQRGESAVKLKQEPVLRYADSTRQTHESALWIWSGGGRPAAILAVEYFPQAKGPQGQHWLYEIASLSTERIAAECEGNFRWTAKEPGLKLQALSDAPSPAEKEIRRLAQMKQLRDRFTAHENSAVNGRIELRPLVTPLLRYSDAQEEVTDGAIFSFASGTNPEVLLVLEAQVVGSKSVWQYALVRMTGEAVAVELDGKEVWQEPRAPLSAVRANYINGWIATSQEEK